MLILAKSVLGLMLGFFISVFLGFITPNIKKTKCKTTSL